MGLFKKMRVDYKPCPVCGEKARASNWNSYWLCPRCAAHGPYTTTGVLLDTGGRVRSSEVVWDTPSSGLLEQLIEPLPGMTREQMREFDDSLFEAAHFRFAVAISEATLPEEIAQICDAMARRLGREERQGPRTKDFAAVAIAGYLWRRNERHDGEGPPIPDGHTQSVLNHYRPESEARALLLMFAASDIAASDSELGSDSPGGIVTGPKFFARAEAFIRAYLAESDDTGSSLDEPELDYALRFGVCLRDCELHEGTSTTPNVVRELFDDDEVEDESEIDEGTPAGRFCEQCGVQASSAAQFCGACGIKLTA
jgi:hypothetical protein